MRRLRLSPPASSLPIFISPVITPPRMVYSLSFLHYLIPVSPSPRADRRRGDEKQCQGSRGERRQGRAVQTGGARHPGFSPASGDSEWEAEGRPLREPRWGVQLGISQGRKTCRPWGLRAPHLGQPPPRPQHIRQPPPKGRGDTGEVATAPGPGRGLGGGLPRNYRAGLLLPSPTSPRPPVAAARARRASRGAHG